MFKAFQLKKLTIGEKEKDEEKIEDGLTASIFQLLSYLPSALIWQILKESIYENNIQIETGLLESIAFWDKWKMKEDDNNENFVEPDVFLSFEKINLIVEAKRWDNNQQDPTQWETQLQGYYNEYPIELEDKKVYLLALGGIRKQKTGKVIIKGQEVKVYKSRWSGLLNTILIYKNKIERQSILTEQEQIQLRIFKDLISSFEYYKFFAGTWLEDEVRLRDFAPSNISINRFLK